MATSSSELINIIPTLTPAQQDAVAAFVRYLQESCRKTPISTENAVEEFMREHSELLQLLAK